MLVEDINICVSAALFVHVTYKTLHSNLEVVFTLGTHETPEDESVAVCVWIVSWLESGTARGINVNKSVVSVSEIIKSQNVCQTKREIIIVIDD